MKTLLQFRKHLLQTLRFGLQRPGMYGGELFIRIRLDDLAVLDGQEAALEALLDVLRERSFFTSIGVVGWFERRMPGSRDFENEAASVWAWVADQLGYTERSRRLDRGETREVRRFANVIAKTDATSLVVEEAIGAPSFVIGGSGHQVHAYAPRKMGEIWIYFDYDKDVTRVDSMPLSDMPFRLRSTRTVSGQGPIDRLRLTPHGRLAAARKR